MTMTGVAIWSQTASTNATADNAVNWSEGQAPSTVNDSARAMMASTAKWRDDIAGAIVTTGTSTAYAVASNQVFDSIGNLHNQIIAFSPHTTCGDNPTLNVDGLGARGLYSASGVSILAGMLIQGTPYVALYSNVDGRFYLHNFYGNPYSIPIGAGVDYWAATAPNSSFAFPYGQAISRTTYATLFAKFSTTYGAGDGSTTFNLPDLRGRVTVAADNMGGVQAGRINIILGNALGSVAGEQQHILTNSEMPSHYHGAGISDPGHTHTYTASVINNSPSGGGSAGLVNAGGGTNSTGASATGVRVTSSNGLDTTYSAGGGATHNNVQPSICCNYIIRII